MKHATKSYRHRGITGAALAALLASPIGASAVVPAVTCPDYGNIVTANVVALDQPFFWNRLGAAQPHGMMFALEHDVEPIPPATTLTTGNVRLKAYKRARPIALRVNVGDCLQINFTNLLSNPRAPEHDEQPVTRAASIHVIGMQLIGSIDDDGSNVGANPVSGLVEPGLSTYYTLYAEREGQHVLYSAGATTGGEGDGGSLNAGLFGSVNVEPAGSTWYRSQVTEDDLQIGRMVDNPFTTTVDESQTPQGHPIINYDATYASGPRAGLPIFKMLNEYDEIVHSDLTAIIDAIPAGTYEPNPVYPERDHAFREFTIMYHDEIGAVQAFPAIFEDDVLSHTTHSVRDAFAINYGSGGIGAEILANRLGVGPMRDCLGCKYEEFFLASAVVGDPAQVVDVPANLCLDDPTCRATEAFYPDDPSNVYHSYLKDHVKFRLLHGGSKEHHIHHQHTHQWLYTPDSDESTYLDSQAIGPGSSFTLEMVYEGSGNRNQAVGDSIFHCHFYPHFAQGMWALWRVHDVFEDGSRMLPDGEIAQGTPIPGLVPVRGYAMAPMPTETVTIAQDPRFEETVIDPLTSLPVVINKRGGQIKINGEFVYEMTTAVSGNPGYPFWVPQVAGSRPPHPAMDFADSDEDGYVEDGGLPRHVLLSGEAVSVQSRLDFTKELHEAEAIEIPEDGNPVELAAMAYHEQRFHDSFRPDGTAATGTAGFVTNGMPRVAGAPYADPCMLEDADGYAYVPAGMNHRTYKAANIQLDVVFNKAGWHFPQQRIITLWDDVQPTFDGLRAPEPFFFRANTNDCITFMHTNLVPNVYELDDFQIRTPTDILGQHIHLVKFDVLASDGSANGWNYEDGNFSPDEVRERIHAIRAYNDCDGASPPAADGTFECPVAEAHWRFGAGPGGAFMGAATSVQRWYADDVLNIGGSDRTLRTVFTHDHFGPSTHQQAGLYASLVIEPKGSQWRDPETGDFLGGTGVAAARPDGGPTSWRADILTVDPADSHREFMFQFQDFTLAYEKDSHDPTLLGLTPGKMGPTFPLPWDVLSPRTVADAGFAVPGTVINPPAKDEPFPALLVVAPECPGGVPRPCPEAISADDVGTMTVNYRNEPIALRVRDPATNSQAAGEAGDLSYVFSSEVTRADPDFNNYGPYAPPRPDVHPTDPFTPLMRAYEGDKVNFRSQVGATEEMHNSSVHGLRWLYEPSDKSSGWKGSQMMGISEQFTFVIPVGGGGVDVITGKKHSADYLYRPGSSTDDLWSGLWSLLRIYDHVQGSGKNSPEHLEVLPNNEDAMLANRAKRSKKNPGAFGSKKGKGLCPFAAPHRKVEAEAWLARDILPAGPYGVQGLVYNSRTTNGGPLYDPDAIILLRKDDIVQGKKGSKKSDPRPSTLKPGVPIEPLIVRANAGDCIEFKLKNQLPDTPLPNSPGYATLPPIVDGFNANDLTPGNNIGIQPQLVALQVLKNASNAGFNKKADGLARPGKSKTYIWYAGDIWYDDAISAWRDTPIEFGAINLMPTDPIKHVNKGAIGALIIEPEGATWEEDTDSRASATVCPDGADPCVTTAADAFREFVLVFQNFVNLRFGSDTSLPSASDEEGTMLTTVPFSAGEAVPNLAETEDPEDSGQKAFNYRTEPMWFRGGWAPDAPLGLTRNQDMADILRNDYNGINADPQTPLFTAEAGMPVRLRVLHPGGNQRNNVFTLHGHAWQQEPYIYDELDYDEARVGSTRMGYNWKSMQEGAYMGHGPSNHFNALLINGAGGKGGVTGDYLYRDMASFQFDGGLWGTFRVTVPE